MRENGERERAVENDPHEFWHRFGRATRLHYKDGIRRAFGCRQKTRSFAARMDVDFAGGDWQTIYVWMIKQMWQLRNIMRKFGE